MGMPSHRDAAVGPQSGHFRLVFGAARKAGILPPEGEPGPRVTHVGFGLVLGDDGKRFRTRSSEVSSSCIPRCRARPEPCQLGVAAVDENNPDTLRTNQARTGMLAVTRGVSASWRSRILIEEPREWRHNVHELLNATPVRRSWCGL